jgi:hypothetical protein
MVEFSSISSGIVEPITGDNITPGLLALPLELHTDLPYFVVTHGATADNPGEEPNNYFSLIADLGQIPSAIGDIKVYRMDHGDSSLHFVPSWGVTTSGNNTILSIASKQGGTFLFSTGPKTDQPTGSVFPEAPAGEYDLTTSSGESPAVTLYFTGANFVTANPLIMISVIPAGSMMGSTVFGQNWFAPNHIASPDLPSLGAEIQGTWSQEYYKEMARRSALEINRGPGFGQIPITIPADNNSYANGTKLVSLNNKIEGGVLPRDSVTIQPSELWVEPGTRRKFTRGLEFIFTVFDGGRVSMARTLMKARFSGSLDSKKKDQIEVADIARIDTRNWQLVSYPWADNIAATKNFYGIVGAVEKKEWNDLRHRVLQYTGVLGAYIEYEGEPDVDIIPDAGHAVWVATWGKRNLDVEVSPKSEGGTTLDNQPFSVIVPANQYFDFGLPFNFPMKWGDIDSASGYTGTYMGTEAFAYNPNWKVFDWEGSTTDNPKWIQDPNQQTWIPLHDTTTMYPWSGCAIRNATEFNLVFPVIDYERSTHLTTGPVLKTAAQNTGYKVVVLASNATAHVHVTMGKQNTQQIVGEPPMVPGQDFQFFLKGKDYQGKTRNLSWDIQSMQNGLQGHWPVQARFLKPSGKISISLLKKENLSDTMGVYLVESVSKKVWPLDKQGTTVSLSQSQVEEGIFSIVVGDEEYARNLSAEHLMKFVNAPNPFSASTVFSFTLPLSLGKLEGIGYALKIYDVSGKVVLHVDDKFAPGSHSLNYIWNGTDNQRRSLPAGYYLVSFRVDIPGFKSFSGLRKVVKLR